MAQSRPPLPPVGKDPPKSFKPKKRKEPPTTNQGGPSKRPDHRQKTRDARTLSAQTSSKAFRNGELDVSSFVKSRAYEIRALEEGMARSKEGQQQAGVSASAQGAATAHG